MAKKKIKVLYFIAGSASTAEDDAAIEKYDARHNVCYRNAEMIGDRDAIEDFDIVAGAVPPRYAEAAEEKGPFVEPSRPTVPAASAPQGSPVAPPASDAGTGEGEGAGEPQDAGNAAKPKAPAPKPEAAKGWKPNA
jgi:hypothetical protein